MHKQVWRMNNKFFSILFQHLPPQLLLKPWCMLNQCSIECATNLEAGMHSWDNVLVDSVEEDGSLTSGSSSNHDKDLNGYETLGVDTEHDAFVERWFLDMWESPIIHLFQYHWIKKLCNFSIYLIKLEKHKILALCFCKLWKFGHIWNLSRNFCFKFIAIFCIPFFP